MMFFKRAVLRVPSGICLIFSMCILSQFVYYNPPDLSIGIITGLFFSLLYALYEGFIGGVEYIVKQFEVRTSK